MVRRRVLKQSHTLEERLAKRALELRAAASLLPRSIEREALLRSAREAELGHRMACLFAPSGEQGRQSAEPPHPAPTGGSDNSFA